MHGLNHASDFISFPHHNTTHLEAQFFKDRSLILKQAVFIELPNPFDVL